MSWLWRILLPDVIRKFVRQGKQIFDEGITFEFSVFREFLQEVLEVLIRLQVIHLRRFGDAVKYRTGLCPMDGIDEIPVLPADRKTADAPFSGLC